MDPVSGPDYRRSDLRHARALVDVLGVDIDPEKSFKRLQAIGVSAPWQIPLFLPTRFLDARAPIDRFFGLQPSEQEVVVIGKYAGDFRTRWRPGARGRHSPQAQGSLQDAAGMRVRFSMFGDARGLQKILEERRDTDIALGGTLSAYGNGIYLNNPIVVEPNLLGYLVPHYPGKARTLSMATARKLVLGLLPSVIPACAEHLRERMHEIVVEDLRVLLQRPQGTLEDLLWEAHLPLTPEIGEGAQKCLERLSALITIGELRHLQAGRCPVRRTLVLGEWRDFIGRVGFELTDEQYSAVGSLVARFGEPDVSATLINADVGMGKSIVYQLASAAAVRSGARVAVLLPNERLAVQAYREIGGMFPELSPLLVTAKSGVRQARGGNWLIGTTAMLFRDVGEIDICVVDEQHRFSVEQRRALAQAGTHVVEISATPIPRTQALLLYGKMDVLRLTKRHSPQEIRTHITYRAQTTQMVNTLRGVVQRGGRILIVCPRREDDEDDLGGSLPSVARVAGKWDRLFPGMVRALHGESDPNDVDQAFADLASGSAQILVATTVVEVGLNIRNLRAVIIVHAERFGLSQLHQLRGRLAREGGEGDCFLYLPEPVGEDASVRLNALASTTDGFQLAEHDMRARGIGDVTASGARQHGSAGSLLLNRQVPMATFLEMLEKLGGQ